MSSTDLQTKRATSIEDWVGYYKSRDDVVMQSGIDIEDFRNTPTKNILNMVRKFIRNGSIIEIGAGDSNLLIEICKRFEPNECYGLDYLQIACDKLAEKSAIAGVNVETICADLFFPPEAIKHKFDFVMSYGVVEHFNDLSAVILAISEFAKASGIIFTLIPNNKDNIYGHLMKCWNIDVYNAHIMYDKNDLEDAHKKAGLEIIWSGYVGSSNFGMLSWCFKGKETGLNYWFYKQLTRISKIVWLFESIFGSLKPSRILAPYIVCVSQYSK